MFSLTHMPAYLALHPFSRQRDPPFFILVKEVLFLYFFQQRKWHCLNDKCFLAIDIYFGGVGRKIWNGFGVRTFECSGISREVLLIAFHSIEASCSWLEENIGAFLPDIPATGNYLNTMTQQLELLPRSVSQHWWLQPPYSVSEASSRINKEMKTEISVHKILLVLASLVASEQEYMKIMPNIDLK